MVFQMFLRPDATTRAEIQFDTANVHATSRVRTGTADAWAPLRLGLHRSGAGADEMSGDARVRVTATAPVFAAVRVRTTVPRAFAVVDASLRIAVGHDGGHSAPPPLLYRRGSAATARRRCTAFCRLDSWAFAIVDDIVLKVHAPQLTLGSTLAQNSGACANVALVHGMAANETTVYVHADATRVLELDAQTLVLRATHSRAWLSGDWSISCGAEAGSTPLFVARTSAHAVTMRAFGATASVSVPVDAPMSTGRVFASYDRRRRTHVLTAAAVAAVDKLVSIQLRDDGEPPVAAVVVEASTSGFEVVAILPADDVLEAMPPLAWYPAVSARPLRGKASRGGGVARYELAQPSAAASIPVRVHLEGHRVVSAIDDFSSAAHLQFETVDGACIDATPTAGPSAEAALVGGVATAPSWAPTAAVVRGDIIRLIGKAAAGNVAVYTSASDTTRAAQLAPSAIADVALAVGRRLIHCISDGADSLDRVLAGRLRRRGCNGFAFCSADTAYAVGGGVGMRVAQQQAAVFGSSVAYAPGGQLVKASATEPIVHVLDPLSGDQRAFTVPAAGVRVLLATAARAYYAYDTVRVASVDLLAAAPSGGTIDDSIELSHPCTQAIELSPTQLLCRLEYGMWTVLQLDPVTHRLIGARPSHSLARALTFSNRQRALVKTATRIVGLDERPLLRQWSVAQNIDLLGTDIDRYHVLVEEGALAWYAAETLTATAWRNGVVPRAAQFDVAAAMAIEPHLGIAVSTAAAGVVAFPVGINGERTLVLVGRGAFIDAATNTRIAADGVRLHGHSMTPVLPAAAAADFYIAVVGRTRARVNGIELTLSAASIAMLHSSSTPWTLRAAAGTDWSIAEVVVFDRALSSAETTLLEGVLLAKYRDARALPWSAAAPPTPLSAALPPTTSVHSPLVYNPPADAVRAVHIDAIDHVLFSADTHELMWAVDATTLQPQAPLAMKGRVLDALGTTVLAIDPIAWRARLDTYGVGDAYAVRVVRPHRAHHTYVVDVQPGPPPFAPLAAPIALEFDRVPPRADAPPRTRDDDEWRSAPFEMAVPYGAAQLTVFAASSGALDARVHLLGLAPGPLPHVTPTTRLVGAAAVVGDASVYRRVSGEVVARIALVAGVAAQCSAVVASSVRFDVADGVVTYAGVDRARGTTVAIARTTGAPSCTRARHVRTEHAITWRDTRDERVVAVRDTPFGPRPVLEDGGDCVGVRAGVRVGDRIARKLPTTRAYLPDYFALEQVVVELLDRAGEPLGAANLTLVGGEVVRCVPAAMPPPTTVRDGQTVTYTTATFPVAAAPRQHVLELGGNVALVVDVLATRYQARVRAADGRLLGPLYGYDLDASPANAHSFTVAAPEWRTLRDGRIVALVRAASVPWAPAHIEPAGRTSLWLEAVGGASAGRGYDLGAFDGSLDRWFVLDGESGWQQADLGRALTVRPYHTSPAQLVRGAETEVRVAVEWAVGACVRVTINNEVPTRVDDDARQRLLGARRGAFVAPSTASSVAARLDAAFVASIRGRAIVVSGGGDALVYTAANVEGLPAALRTKAYGVVGNTIVTTQTTETISVADVPTFSTAPIFDVPRLYVRDAHGPTPYATASLAERSIDGLCVHVLLRMSRLASPQLHTRLGTVVEIENVFRLSAGFTPSGLRVRGEWRVAGGGATTLNLPMDSDTDGISFSFDARCASTEANDFELFIKVNGLASQALVLPSAIAADLLRPRITLADVTLGGRVESDYFLGAVRAFALYSTSAMNTWYAASASLTSSANNDVEPTVSRPEMRLPSITQPMDQLNVETLRVADVFISEAVSSFTGGHLVHLSLKGRGHPMSGQLVKVVGQASAPHICQTTPIVELCGPGEVAFGVYERRVPAAGMHMVLAVGEGALLVSPTLAIEAGTLLVCGEGGFAVPQRDDIIRANTVAKATETVVPAAAAAAASLGGRLIAVSFMM